MQHEASRGRGGRNNVFASLVQNGMAERDLRKSFYDQIDTTDPEARKKAFWRARDWAIKSGLVEIKDGIVFVIRGEK